MAIHFSVTMVTSFFPTSSRRRTFGSNLGRWCATPSFLPGLHRTLNEKLERISREPAWQPRFSPGNSSHPRSCIVASGIVYSHLLDLLDELGLNGSIDVYQVLMPYPLNQEFIPRLKDDYDRVLVIEETYPVIEIQLAHPGAVGKQSGGLPKEGELTPDLLLRSLSGFLDLEPPVQAEPPARGQRPSLCPGCPHRASFWNIKNVLQLDNRQGFVCGDIGCYSMAVLPTGFSSISTMHSMGSGTGVASGFGQLGRFGMDQPVFAVCGDSTFFHAVMPALVNAVHHKSDITLVVLDNSGTAMTGFQPHPGLDKGLAGEPVQTLDIQKICESMGITVRVADPFDFEKTQQLLFDLLEIKDGVKVLIMKQACALSPDKKHTKLFEMKVDESSCQGQDCGCNRLCTRIFRCPGLVWNKESGTSNIDEAICVGCGICADICPVGAISKKEAA